MGGILACVDFSDMTVPVIRRAVTLAAGGVVPAAVIHLLHVAAPEPGFVGFDTDPVTNWSRDDRSHELLDEHRRLIELAHEHSTADVEVKPIMAMGPTVETILEEVPRLDIDVIVVGSHGHGALYHLLMGSIATHLTKLSPVPVEVVPHPARVAPR